MSGNVARTDSLLHQFPSVAMTDDHNLGDLQQKNFTLSQFWRPKIQSQAISRVGSFWRSGERVSSMSPSQLLLVAGNPQGSLVQRQNSNICLCIHMTLLSFFKLFFGSAVSSLQHTSLLCVQVGASGGYSLVEVHRLLIVMASLVAEHKFQGGAWMLDRAGFSSCGPQAWLPLSM